MKWENQSMILISGKKICMSVNQAQFDEIKRRLRLKPKIFHSEYRNFTRIELQWLITPDMLIVFALEEGEVAQTEID